MWFAAIAVVLMSPMARADAQRGAPPPPPPAQPPVTKAAPDTIKKVPLSDSARQAAADSARQQAVADSARNARAQARVDSIARVKAADTIKAPLAHFETPADVEQSARLHFTREQILATGAINLADILDRVPGITTYRSGWMSGIHTAAFNGNFQRIRVFFDGVERDVIESRNNGVLDLNDIPIVTLDDITIERAATEVRVWLRGWTVRRTTAYTRVDIFTGDLNTNGFRGYFAKRFDNGLSLQFVGQQAATQTGRVSAFTTSELQSGNGDGSQQLVEVRLGWARRKWTVDLHGTGISRDRDPTTARVNFTDLPRFKGGSRDVYARVAYGDSAKGLWAQALVGVLRTDNQGIGNTIVVDSAGDTTKVSLDTIQSRTQQIAVAGYRAERWQLSAMDRIRPVAGTVFHAPAVRASIGGDGLRASAYAEQRGIDSTTVYDISGIARPTSWLNVVASIGQRSPSTETGRHSTSSQRAELFLRLRRLWFSGGIIREGVTTLASPTLLGAPDATVSAVASSGLIGSVHGPIYKAIRLDVQAIHWDGAQYYRPRLDVRSELSLQTNWLSRFPKGEFGFHLSVMHESRDPIPFYWPSSGTTTSRVAEMSQVVTGLLEIRIQSATLFYQYRNLTGQAYEQIPGHTMPPAVQMYGVRWEFWN